MSASEGPWTIQHFPQANPKGPGQGDVPALLRRVADTLEQSGVDAVQDVVFHRELDRDGADWPSVTVYFHAGEAE